MRHEEIQDERIALLANKLSEDYELFPQIIEIHPTDKCNHRCFYCFHEGKGYNKSREREILSLDQYLKLFYEMKHLDIHNLSIAGGGEPFLDTRIAIILRGARKSDLITRIVTNGTLLTDEILAEVIYCREIRFSIDSFTEETYSKIRNVNGSMRKIVIKNLEKIINTRNNHHNSELKIGVSFIVSELNINELLDFCNEMNLIDVDTIIVKYDIYDQTPFSDHIRSNVDKAKKISDKVESRVDEKIAPFGLSCFVPYFKVSFNPYGELFSCCLGSQPGEKNGYFLGNLHNQSLREIWKASRDLRQKLIMEGVQCVNCNYTDHKINRRLIKNETISRSIRNK